MDRSHAGVRSIEALASQQFGLFSRRQAMDLGVTRHNIDSRLASGVWLLVLPSVFRVAVVARSRRQDAMAAALWSWPDGLVSHATAAQLWLFEGIRSDDVQVTVPAGRKLRSEFVTVHRTKDRLPADLGWRGPIPVTSALRTAIDLAAVVDSDTLEIAIESALRRRLFSVGQLRWRAEALMGTGRRGSKQLRALLGRRDLGRAESRWEVRVAQLLESAGCGAPVRQHSIRDERGREIARVDLAYPAARVVLEYDSDQWHCGTARRHRDARRRNSLRALGWMVVEITPADLKEPVRLLEVLELVLAA